MFHTTFFRSITVKFGSYLRVMQRTSEETFFIIILRVFCQITVSFFLISEFTMQNSSRRDHRAPSCLPLLLAAWKRLHRSSLKTPEGYSAVHCVLLHRPRVTQNLRQTAFPASARFEHKPHLSVEDCDDVLA